MLPAHLESFVFDEVGGVQWVRWWLGFLLFSMTFVSNVTFDGSLRHMRYMKHIKGVFVVNAARWLFSYDIYIYFHYSPFCLKCNHLICCDSKNLFSWVSAVEVIKVLSVQFLNEWPLLWGDRKCWFWPWKWLTSCVGAWLACAALVGQ